MFRSTSSNDADDMERNLAMLAAQYEKTSQDQEPDQELDPGHLAVKNSRERLDRSTEALDSLVTMPMPPAMAILNNSSDTVKLARELRHKRDQLEELMKKNVFRSGLNESASGSAGLTLTRSRVKDSNNRSGVCH